MGITHYISIIYAPIITIWLTIFFNKFNCYPLKNIGYISLESYLVNERIALIFIFIFGQNGDYYYLINLIAFVITIIVAYLLRWATDWESYKEDFKYDKINKM